MANITEKSMMRMKLAAAAPSDARTDVSVRDVGLTIDEPRERGGTNAGPSPVETMLAALLGCTNVITHKVAEKNGVELKSMRLRLEAEFDFRGARLKEEIAVPFPKIKLFIDVVTDADEQRMAAVKRELGMFCPVSKVIRAAGTELEEIWTVTRQA